MNEQSRSRASRREFLQTAGAFGACLTLPRHIRTSLRNLDKSVKFGLIADLHQDVMHDGEKRLNAFLMSMRNENPDAIIQLGDFAYPTDKNKPLIESFNKAHSNALHVLGNHEIDAGHSFEEVASLWGMPSRYYSMNVEGLDLIVLDGNEKPENHQRGYPAHVGAKQLQWLEAQIKQLSGPIIVFCHQPLAGPSCIDNAKQAQKILNDHAEKILLTINGHTHIDHLVRVGKIINLHINSASYYWVGGSHQHQSYSDEIHTAHPYIQYTCPYEKPLFTTLTIEPVNGRIILGGNETKWVGKSPAQLGLDSDPTLTDGEEICPRIRDRSLLRPPVKRS